MLAISFSCHEEEILPGAKVAHACNPSYSGGRVQEDHGSKPACANSARDHILKKPITNIELVEWLKVKALSSNPSTTKNKNKKTPVLPKKKERKKMGAEVHVCYSSYSGGRDQVHNSWKPAHANSSSPSK
jgi:hypothetical protein